MSYANHGRKDIGVDPDHAPGSSSSRIAGPSTIPSASRPIARDDVLLLPITQATSATFVDLYFERAFLFFIEAGSKRVHCPIQGEVVGTAGDVMIFPPGSMVTMENRPLIDAAYRAQGLSFSHELVDAVFAGLAIGAGPFGVQMLREEPHRPAAVLQLVRETLDRTDLPEAVKSHRLIEPLIWLRSLGIRLSTRSEQEPMSRVRRLIASDLERNWRVAEVAESFAMSEATFRRWLARSGSSFGRILHHTRLEAALARLQGTALPISTIALDCGFKTPSHFSAAFRQRFGISPRQIRIAAD